MLLRFGWKLIVQGWANRENVICPQATFYRIRLEYERRVKIFSNILWQYELEMSTARGALMAAPLWKLQLKSWKKSAAPWSPKTASRREHWRRSCIARRPRRRRGTSRRSFETAVLIPSMNYKISHLRKKKIIKNKIWNKNQSIDYIFPVRVFS